MRQIKFRWYDRRRNKIYNNSETIIYLDGSVGNDYDSDHNVLAGQFTGLLDINSIELYEGDIVNFKGHVCEVVYRDNYCDFVFNIRKWESRLLNVTKANITKYNCEIIGNIYTTPCLC